MARSTLNERELGDDEPVFENELYVVGGDQVIITDFLYITDNVPHRLPSPMKAKDFKVKFGYWSLKNCDRKGRGLENYIIVNKN